LSNWSSAYRIAGIRLEIVSSVGDPTAYLPLPMSGFVSRGPGPPDIAVLLRADEEAQADPLRRFFPSQFVMESRHEGLSFDGSDGRRKGLGLISSGCARAELGLPPLDRRWRIAEEEVAVREAVQAFVRACLQCRLMEEGGTLMHAAGIAWGGEGFVFTGHTRSGKTTLSREFPLETVLGDDLIAVRGERDGFTLYGTPWPGREGGSTAYGGAPLRAVFNLHPELEAGLYVQSPGEALAELTANAPRMGYTGEESKLLAVFSSLTQAVPIYRLSIGLGDDAMPYIRQVSSKEGGGDRPDGK
jgi:hypothetical protein